MLIPKIEDTKSDKADPLGKAILSNLKTFAQGLKDFVGLPVYSTGNDGRRWVPFRLKTAQGRSKFYEHSHRSSSGRGAGPAPEINQMTYSLSRRTVEEFWLPVVVRLFSLQLT